MLISVVKNVDTNYNVPRSQNATNDPVKENAKWTCQDILKATILPALPSDKHVPGMEPREKGKTTDAIRSRPSLLYEPGWDTSKKHKCNPREQTQTMFHLVSHGLPKALHTHGQMLIVYSVLWCLCFRTNTYRKILLGIFCHLSHPSEPKEGFWEHY